MNRGHSVSSPAEAGRGQPGGVEGPSGAPVVDVCVARQPIFDRTGEVTGYELLYRETATSVGAGNADRRVMAADVLVHAFLTMGLEQLTSGRTAYLNFPRDVLLSGAYTLLPPTGVVIELLENVEPDADVEAACERLVDAGYALALDDFVWDTKYQRLLELASIVKVDVLHASAEQLDDIARRLAVYNVTLLAERVETAAVRDLCAGLGYELFQGYYYARPEIVRQRALTNDEMAVVRAISVLRDPTTTDADVEAAFASDVGLSYKLLRMVNSAASGGRGIESIRHAVRLSGRGELTKWLALILVSSIAGRGTSRRELLQLAVQRARLCELLAAQTARGRDASGVFLVGLFSLLDAISGIPMSDLLASVPLAPALRDALVARTGPYAAPLTIAEAYERGAWDVVWQQASSSGIDASQLGPLYVQSLAWMRARLVSLGGVG